MNLIDISKKLAENCFWRLVDFDSQLTTDRREQIYFYHSKFHYTPIFFEKPCIINDQCFMSLEFQFEDQWKKYNDNVSDFMFNTIAELTAPNNYDKMRIKKRSEQKAKDRIRTTNFEEISLS